MGNAFQETGKKRENMRKHEKTTIVQRSLLVTRFMLKLQKLLIKYSNKGVRLLLGSFSFFITCSSLHGNYGWRLGASWIWDASSNRRITVQVKWHSFATSHKGIFYISMVFQLIVSCYFKHIFLGGTAECRSRKTAITNQVFALKWVWLCRKLSFRILHKHEIGFSSFRNV